MAWLKVAGWRRTAVLNRSEDVALLLGRLFVAALFLPLGANKLLTFSTYAASLRAKGLPYATVIAAVMVAAQVLGSLALILGAWPRWTALVLVAFTAVTLWTAHRNAFVSTLMRPRQNGEFYRTLAIMGGLLFYFASGPGAWSWKGGAGRTAKA
jgi:putative oxidoreductase